MTFDPGDVSWVEPTGFVYLDGLPYDIDRNHGPNVGLFKTAGATQNVLVRPHTNQFAACMFLELAAAYNQYTFAEIGGPMVAGDLLQAQFSYIPTGALLI